MAVSRINEAGLNVNQYGNRNLIINGAMTVAQRGTSAVTSDGAYPVDRFEAQHSSDGAFSAQQSSVVPSGAGFKNSLKVETTTADSSLAATQYLYIRQIIEGQNISHLLLGSSSAKKITLSFWVRSSLTGTFGGSFWNDGFDRSYPYTYTINAADTWEKKTITITGDTSGTWLTTNGRGLNIAWGLGVGSTYSGTAGAWAGSGLISATGATSLLGTLNATWYITGVQLEVGDTATDFEHRSYADELARCRRYYEVTPAASASAPVIIGSGMWYVSSAAYVTTFYSNKRTDPTITAPTVTSGYRFYYGNNFKTVNSIAFQRQKPDNARVSAASSGATQGDGSWGEMVETGAKIEIDAEL